MNLVKTSLEIDAELHAEIRKYCETEGAIMGKVTQKLWRKYLQEHYAAVQQKESA